MLLDCDDEEAFFRILEHLPYPVNEDLFDTIYPPSVEMGSPNSGKTLAELEKCLPDFREGIITPDTLPPERTDTPLREEPTSPIKPPEAKPLTFLEKIAFYCAKHKKTFVVGGLGVLVIILIILVSHFISRVPPPSTVKDPSPPTRKDPSPPTGKDATPPVVEIIAAKDAWKFMNKTVTVEMIVRSGRQTTARNGRPMVFLDSLEGEKPFTVVIFSEGLEQFHKKGVDDPPAYYKGKKVRVAGLIEEYKGNPEIKVNSPDQMKVVD
jgi:DNA/RNA endonuclease YhcR with UshA esterase domain